MEKKFSEVLKKWENREFVDLSDEENEEILRIAREIELQDKILNKIFFVPTITKPLYLSKGYKNKKYKT